MLADTTPYALSVTTNPTGITVTLHRPPPTRGEICHRHFSWRCQAGQGKCQTDTNEDR